MPVQCAGLSAGVFMDDVIVVMRAHGGSKPTLQHSAVLHGGPVAALSSNQTITGVGLLLQSCEHRLENPTRCATPQKQRTKRHSLNISTRRQPPCSSFSVIYSRRPSPVCISNSTHSTPAQNAHFHNVTVLWGQTSWSSTNNTSMRATHAFVVTMLCRGPQHQLSSACCCCCQGSCHPGALPAAAGVHDSRRLLLQKRQPLLCQAPQLALV